MLRGIRGVSKGDESRDRNGTYDGDDVSRMYNNSSVASLGRGIRKVVIHFSLYMGYL